MIELLQERCKNEMHYGVSSIMWLIENDSQRYHSHTYTSQFSQASAIVEIESTNNIAKPSI